MGLFSKPKIPGIDTGALTRIAEQNAATQRDLLGRKKLALQPLTEQFRTDRTAFSGQIEPGTENLLTRLGQDVSNIGAQEKTANEAAGIAQREQSFREVPAMQRAIRESLGGSGLLRSGGAVGQVAQPIIDAARSSRDFTSGLETTRLGNEARRAEGLASTGFNARTAALNQRLGFDENTLNTLAELGRTDLIDEYNALAGIEADLGSSRLSIEQARQANAIEQAKASASRRAGILGSLGSVAGAGIGSLGGPLGIALGSQIGGQIGNFAGGGTPTGFDPTLLVALSQQRQTANQNRQNAIRNSLGGRGYN
jgi:hypothetical protein